MEHVFTVKVGYTTINGGAIDATHIRDDINDLLVLACENGQLNQRGVYAAQRVSVEFSGITPVAKIDTPYTEAEVDAALCVFDEFIGQLAWAFDAEKFEKSDASTDKKAYAKYLEALHSDGGTPHLRDTSMRLGRLIESIWLELVDAGLTEPWIAAWDFEYVPEVLFTAWLNGKEFPELSNRTQWLAASLSALGYESETIRAAKLENMLRGKPEIVNDIRAAAKHFSAAVRAIGADELTQYMQQSSSNIEDELNDLASLLDFVDTKVNDVCS